MAGEAANLHIDHLPFEVREVREDRPVVSVARGTLGETVELAPGSYVVAALTPDGQVFTTNVDVQSEQTAEARLEHTTAHGTESQPIAEKVIIPLPRASDALAERVREQISKQGPSLFEGLKALALFALRLLLRQAQQKIDLGWLQKLLTSQIQRMPSFESLQQVIDSLLKPEWVSMAA